ncbi:MAG: glycosyltransferase [Terriglobales bacterium]
MPVHAIAVSNYKPRASHDCSAPLLLATDAFELTQLPDSLRALHPQIWLRARWSGDAPPGASSWLYWRAHEQVLAGDLSALLADCRQPGRRVFLPVHYGCGEWELIGLEPRCFGPAPAPDASGANTPIRLDAVDLRFRIAAAPPDLATPASAPSAQAGQGPVGPPAPPTKGGTGAEGALGPAPTNVEPWQRLRAALEAEYHQMGAGVAALAQLAAAADLHPIVHALVLRNLIVALLRQGERASAKTLLQQSLQLHPGYRELAYLDARIALAEGRPADALAALKRATAPEAADAASGEAPLYVGCGGEAGYRSHYLLALMAEHAGRQQVALHHFLSGVRQRPAFAPAVAGLLRQRLTPDHFAALHDECSRLGRHHPQWREPLLDFCLLHQDPAWAHALLQRWPLAPAERAVLAARLEAAAPSSPPERPADAPAGVLISGPLLTHSSIALINRRLAAALAADGRLELVLEPTQLADHPPAAFARHQLWAPALKRPPRHLALTIRHGWPPDFRRPASGRLAVILPWEFGAIPRRWVAELNTVDAIWVPSAFVRAVLARAGVELARIEVVPNGVDLDVFTPQGERQRPAGARGCEFLFVGGAIERKGIDLLLQAWPRAFSSADDVSLVIKAAGAQSFYRHLSWRDRIQKLAQRDDVAPVLYDESDLDDAAMPQLYRGADVVVLPYRGEGFGLPLAEALACGKPVIATGLGPAAEFVPPAAGWLLPAVEAEVPRHLHPPELMTGPFTWFEPDLDALVASLRAAAANAAERCQRGQAGADHARQALGWDRILGLYQQRWDSLLELNVELPAAAEPPADAATVCHQRLPVRRAPSSARVARARR